MTAKRVVRFVGLMLGVVGGLEYSLFIQNQARFSVMGIRIWFCPLSDAELILENLALRHQLQIALRSHPRPRLSNHDRFLWVSIRRVFPGSWPRYLVVVRPETVIGWYRRGVNESQLVGLLREFAAFYNRHRRQRNLDMYPPRPHSLGSTGPIVSRPILGGLHHVYLRTA